MPDRVVLDGQRAVPARVRHLEPIALEDLLAHLDVVGQPLAVLQGAVAAFVEGHLGVDQRAMLLEELWQGLLGRLGSESGRLRRRPAATRKATAAAAG